MDFAYSPHREGGGTMHLHSPTHPHGYRMEGLSSIQQLRRSLSRSPSKPSRFHLRKSDSPSGSQISPLALARAFSPKAHKANSPAVAHPESPLSSQTPAATTVKKKFALRRAAPFRSSPRNRNPKSPRRVLSDSSDNGNASPFAMGRPSGEENAPVNASVRRISAEHRESMGTEQKPATRYSDMNDKPIKFGLSRSRPDTNAPGANCLVPAKSSPLKRSDGIMNLGLDSVNMDSPVAKRRSLHGGYNFPQDFDIFDQDMVPQPSEEELQEPQSTDVAHGFSFSSPMPQAHTPLRRSASMRKQVSQRFPLNTPRSKPAYDGDNFAIPGPAASKTRNRMSLDSSLSYSTTSTTSRIPTNFEPSRSTSYQTAMRTSTGSNQPHPLSIALTPSSSTSSLMDQSPCRIPQAAPTPAAPRHNALSRSLPIGATRPQVVHEPSEEAFATPLKWHLPPPEPSEFRSTGFLSKKNRNVDETAGGTFGLYEMPGTPSKRNSFPPVADSPSIYRSSVFSLGKATPQKPTFGTPSTPNPTMSTFPAESFGKGVNIFGTRNGGHERRGSFVSIDGDDSPPSPSGKHLTDGQSSADDMPPTPTKHNDGRRSKESSLRRKTFRQRASLGSNTFSPTAAPSIDIPASLNSLNVNPFGGTSPRTPNESAVPDPSMLSISGHRRGSLPLNNSPSFSYPPATPTTPRETNNYFGVSTIVPVARVTKNDVDESLAGKFQFVTMFGSGEFSEVYRVVEFSRSFGSPRMANPVWAVKKTKKAFNGPQGRQRQLREVNILKSLQGHDHILSYVDHWEHNNHLYLQTEFCENGNLKDFAAQVGYKSRLDDFRIWKILLELSLGIKYMHENGVIHLDLKPANIFIDFHGSLKIGDFGLATHWPTPPHTDGEGDRSYLAPEALQGRVDKPTDIYHLGMIMLEIAGNIVLPENGDSWQRLRSGDFTEMPSLTWSSESSLSRDSNGDPIPAGDSVNASSETIYASDTEYDPLKDIKLPSTLYPTGGLDTAPSFMTDQTNPNSMDRIAQWMMSPDPNQRPTIEQVYACGGCQWVEKRTRAGATIYEGNFGPPDDVLHHDVDMEDMMDTS